MKKTSKKSVVGCRGRRLKIEVEKSEMLLQSDSNLIQKGKVVGAGPDAVCKVGDIIIFNSWGLDSVELDNIKHYFIIDTDEFVLEILNV